MQETESKLATSNSLIRFLTKVWHLFGENRKKQKKIKQRISLGVRLGRTEALRLIQRTACTVTGHGCTCASTHMHVYAPVQLGTFVVAWPEIRQCPLCSGKERAGAIAQIHAHTHTYTHTHTHTHTNIPMDSQGWRGAE